MRRPSRLRAPILMAAPVLGVAHPALADDPAAIEALRATIAAQQRSLEAQAALLEQQRQAIAALDRKLDALAGPDPAPSDPTPAAFAGPGLKVAGYVQTDALYFPKARTGEAEDLLLPRLINTTSAAASRDRSRLSARASRLSLEARWPTAPVPLRAVVEFDFFGQAPATAQAQTNGYEPRLRQAYVELGPGRDAWSLTLGQTWSAFADPESYGPFYNASPFGAVFVRQAQIRYTRWLDPDTRLFVSVENPQGEIAGAGGEAFDTWPDLVVGGRIDRGWGHVQVSGLLRAIQESPPDDRALGWGLMLSSVLRPGFASDDRLRAQVSGGRGVGRYISDLGAGFDGVVETDGAVRTRPVLALSANYQHAWSPRWRSALGLSAVEVDAPPSSAVTTATLAEDVRGTRVITANLVFSPVTALDLAAEITLGEKEDGLGRRARARLYRLSSRLSF